MLLLCLLFLWLCKPDIRFYRIGFLFSFQPVSPLLKKIYTLKHRQLMTVFKLLLSLWHLNLKAQHLPILDCVSAYVAPWTSGFVGFFQITTWSEESGGKREKWQNVLYLAFAPVHTNTKQCSDLTEWRLFTTMLCKMTLGTPRVGDSVTFSIHHRVESLSLTASRQPHDGRSTRKREEKRRW